MKAVICGRYGPPEVLEIHEVPKPVPKNNEVLVKIVATAVNSGDVRTRGLVGNVFMRILMRLILGFNKPRKPILGVVYSGVIESIGDNVSKFKVGDAVFGMTGFSFGTYAEYCVAKETDSIASIPKNATHEEAVSLIFGGQTAIYFLEKLASLQKNNPKILIIGATGSVGVSAIQIAQYYGFDITAVCSSRGKDLVESLGVSKIVLYDTGDFDKLANTYDFIFDAVGVTTKSQCGKLLEAGGVYKTVGGLDTASESVKQLELLKELFETGRLKAVIDKTFSFDQIVDAHRYVDTGRKKGNVVLQIVKGE